MDLKNYNNKNVQRYKWGQTVHEFNIGSHTSLSMFTTVFAESQFEPQVTKSFAHKPESLTRYFL